MVNPMYFVKVAELIGRDVSIAVKYSPSSNEIGKLHCLDDNGALLRAKSGYVFIPWKAINYIWHRTEKKETSEDVRNASEVVVKKSEKRERSITTESITELFDEDFQIEEDGDDYIIYDSEGETVIDTTIEDKEVTVYFEEYIEQAKDIARIIKAKYVIEDWE